MQAPRLAKAKTGLEKTAEVLPQRVVYRRFFYAYALILTPADYPIVRRTSFQTELQSADTQIYPPVHRFRIGCIQIGYFPGQARAAPSRNDGRANRIDE